MKRSISSLLHHGVQQDDSRYEIDIIKHGRIGEKLDSAPIGKQVMSQRQGKGRWNPPEVRRKVKPPLQEAGVELLLSQTASPQLDNQQAPGALCPITEVKAAKVKNQELNTSRVCKA